MPDPIKASEIALHCSSRQTILQANARIGATSLSTFGSLTGFTITSRAAIAGGMSCIAQTC